MASVTLGQHLGQHHLDSEKQFFKKPLERKKLTRKSWHGMMTRKRTPEPVGPAAAVPAWRVSINHQQPSEARGGTTDPDSESSTAEPPRSMDRLIADRVDASETPKCGCVKSAVLTDKDAARVFQHSRTDRENVNGNNNGILGSSAAGGRRPSVKDTTADTNQLCSSSLRSGGRRSSYRGEVLEGLELDRLTQGKTGVVKLMRIERPRREAWSIFNQDDPRVKKENGEGHLFAAVKALEDWCDACSRRIESKAMRCKHCSYTCHLHCEGLVQLDCNQTEGQAEGSPNIAPCRQISKTPPLKITSDEDESPKSLTEEEVKAKLEEYNSKVSENGMNLAENSTYTGFIKVHLKLRRPVTVLPQDGNDSACGEAAEGRDRRTSFYLPSDTVKQLHVSSCTTVTEVIQGLLKKYMVEDNPCKFALYRQTHRDGQDLFQKLPGSEHPLVLRLLAGPDPENLSFVLRENETGEVEWHAFSVPELQNFLAILEKEERERLKLVKQRYLAYREKLQEALQEVQSKPG
ncbi:ras association domain-containing protein 5 [Brachyhypopomus gauderio]|uniref:ras association domain-containing protein 5 n=1 Tax=Brachyhypopomus gauderio TaxID=698409 RepID=UPI0040425840